MVVGTGLNFKKRYRPTARKLFGCIELLRRTLEKVVLTIEKLQTVFCHCESVLNLQPFTYLTENLDFLVFFPFMVLIEIRNLVLCHYYDFINRQKIGFLSS